MKKKMIKRILLLVLVAIVAGGSYALYMYYMPHRDVQKTEAFVEVEATALVNEYLEDQQAANAKYLDEEGESKVIIVSGIVASVDEDQNMQKVVVLKSEHEQLGVSCTFTSETNKNAENLKPGDRVRIKGVVRSGAEYDEDLDLYEDAILEKCDVVE